MRNFYKLTFAFLFSLCAKAQTPTLSITSSISNTALCSGVTVTLSAHADYDATTHAINSYSWIVRPASSVSFLSPNKTDSTLRISFLSGGSYTVLLTCGFSPQDTIMVFKRYTVGGKAEAAFNATFSNEGFPNSLQLTNYSNNSHKSYWVFDNDFSKKDSSFNMVKNYPASGSHTVTLIAVSENNCADTSHYAFRIEGVSELRLPNVFTPNGDGANDVYKPIAKGLSKMNAWVYNRNGILMCSWNTVNGFWDGHTTSGEPCVDGEYFIVVDAEGFDGKVYKLKSAITLLH